MRWRGRRGKSDYAPQTEPSQLKQLLQARKFLDEMARSIRNIIYASFPNTTSAEREDIEQEVKLKLWKMAAEGKDIENFRSYLWKVVYTTACDLVEDRLKAASLDVMMESQDQRLMEKLQVDFPRERVSSADAAILIREALQLLPQRRRSAVQLYCLGLDHKQIAKSLSLTEHQARHLLYRGLDELKRKFGNPSRNGDSGNGNLKP